MLMFLLIVIGFASRFIPHVSQFTAILAVAMLAGMYLKPRFAIITPLVLMVASDFIMGFHDTMFYTWGSMLAISAIGLWLRQRKSLPVVVGGSVLSAVLFFVVTNFGAWLSPLYPNTWEGLQACYVMAIPFFRSTLVSTVAYSIVLYVAYEWALKRSQGTSLARML